MGFYTSLLNFVSLSTVFLGPLFTSTVKWDSSKQFLQRTKSALLKSRTVILLFFSTPPSSQGPKLHCLMAIVRQPSTFMSPTSPSLFVRTRSSQAPLLVVWALSSMLYRNCMDCLCAAVLSLQQMLGFLKLPMRTGASEHGSASSCVSSWPGGLQQMSTPCCPYWSDLQSLPLVICPQVELHTF